MWSKNTKVLTYLNNFECFLLKLIKLSWECVTNSKYEYFKENFFNIHVLHFFCFYFVNNLKDKDI